MATNAIQGDLVGVWVATNLTTPVWKEIVCAENTGLDGSSDVNTKRTKCGVVKGYGPFSWTISGSGTFNSAPTSTQASAAFMLAAADGETPLAVKIAHATDTALVYRQGQGQITKYTEGYNTGDPLSFDFTIDLEGHIDVTP